MDNREYEQIVKTHIDTVYRIALSYTKTSADADDVVQQTFLKLLTKMPDFTDSEHEKRWLIRVCINECHNLLCLLQVTVYVMRLQERHLPAKSVYTLTEKNRMRMLPGIRMKKVYMVNWK